MNLKPANTDPPMPGRRRPSTTPPPPPDFYFPPKLGGDPEIPKPVVTTRTTKNRSSNITISGERGFVPLPYGLQRVLCGSDSVLYSFKPGAAFGLVADELWYVVGIGAGEVGGLLSSKINGTDLSMLSDRIELWFHNGSAAQTYDTNLGAVDPSWRENLPGICYAVVRLKNISKWWTALPTIEILFQGLTCLDPRTGLTTFTTNTVLQLYDLARRSQGKNLPASIINTASIIAAANIADELMADGTRRYTSHVLVQDQTDVEDWLKVFRLLCDGWFTYRQGQFHLILDRPAAITAAYDDAHLVFEEPELERADPATRINHVRVSWLNPATWKEEPLDEYASDDVRLGLVERNTATYRLPWIQDQGRARRLAIYLLNSFVFDAKLRVHWAGTTTLSASGDVVTQSVGSFGIGAQSWRVLSRAFTEENSYLVELGEYNLAKYSNAVATASDAKIASTYPDVLADPLDIDPASISISESYYEEQVGFTKTRARITFTAPPDQFYETTEVSLAINGGPFEYANAFRESPALVPLTELSPGTTYRFQLRVRNKFGRRSAGVAVDFAPEGKHTPPTTVPYFRAACKDGRVMLKWQRALDVDLLGYEVRRLWGTATAADWDIAVPVDKTDALTLEDWPPLGMTTYLIKAYDSGKHYSAVAAVAYINVVAAGALTEQGAPLVFYDQLTESDYVAGSGLLIAEGITTGRPQFLLCRSDTWDDIAAYMTSHGMTTLDAYDASRASAELCFPLPTNASGAAVNLGAVVGGSSTRNLEYWVRLANPRRIGRTDNVDTHAIAEPIVSGTGASSGEHFTIGPQGFPVRWGVHLSTNDPWAQVIVTPDAGGNVFLYSKRRVMVPLGVYEGITDAAGHVTITLPADKQLGSLEEFEVRPFDTDGLGLVVFPIAQDNTSVTLAAMTRATPSVPAVGAHIRAVFEDHGRGGTFSMSIF